MEIKCFEPIINENSTTLILGTIPGVDSLEKQNYYGNSRNQFWDILVRVFDGNWNQFDIAGQVLNYDQKIDFLLRNKLALWDVIACCEREGSSDRSIRKAQINNFEDFFHRHPAIQTVIFNSRSARYYFSIKYDKETFGKKIVVLNSTSTLNPNNTFVILKEWKLALNP